MLQRISRAAQAAAPARCTNPIRFAAKQQACGRKPALTMNVVLADNSDGTIKGKPSKVPEGKLDINISATCDSAHVSSGDDDTNSTDPGTTDPGNGQNPEDNLWNNEDFGIQ